MCIYNFSYQTLIYVYCIIKAIQFLPLVYLDFQKHYNIIKPKSNQTILLQGICVEVHRHQFCF